MSHEGWPREERRDPQPAPVVMVIDDDGEMRAVLRDFLAREGFDVHEEAGGEGVVVAIESLHPAVNLRGVAPRVLPPRDGRPPSV